MKATAAEALVGDALLRHGLKSRRFSKQELRGGKTPDFRVYSAGDLAFFLEVKELTEKLKHGPGDSIMDRIASYIYNAVAQFDAVNPAMDHPNVLAIVNRNPAASVGDLEEVVTGSRQYDSGPHPTGLRWSEGRIREVKDRIHLFIWIEAADSSRLLFRFNFSDPMHLSRLASYFDVDPSTIPTIAA